MMNVSTEQINKQALIAELMNAGVVFRGNSIKCPFHDDRHPSAGLYQGQDGIWRFKCQACGINGDIFDIRARLTGRSLDDILREASGRNSKPARKVFLSMTDLRQFVSKNGQIEAEYDYTNPNSGKVELIVFRLKTTDGKSFKQASPVSNGYVLSAPPKPWPLYNRSRIKDAGTIVVVEGEKLVEALQKYGIVGTTSPCGAGKAEYADWSLLAGKNVILWPDCDEPGRTHIQDVERILLALEPVPRISFLEPAGIDLSSGEDVVDFIEQLKVAGKSESEIKTCLYEALSKAKPKGIAASVLELVEDTISGKRQAIPWPWDTLSHLTKALMPGVITMICGSGGASKSLMKLQCLAFWYQQGVRACVYELENDRDYHLMRALAQRMENSSLTDPDWVRGNAKQARAATQSEAEFLDGFGRLLWEAPNSQVTLEQLAHWVDERAKSGYRIICIDPVTLATKTAKPWIVDNAFLQNIRRSAVKYGCSIVLVSHPIKTVSFPDMHQLAGSADYARLTGVILWLENHYDDKKTSNVTMAVGTIEIEHNRTIHILKARDGRGTGLKLAFNFDGQSLTLREEGVIVRRER